MKKQVISSLSLLFLLLCSNVFAGNYYVSPTGNNNNAGTLAAPFKTIQKALDVAVAGSNIYVRAGTYKERLYWTNTGASGSPVALSNYNGEIVYVDGSSGGTNSAQKGMIEIGSKSYLRITGLQIRNNYKNNATGIYIVGSGNDIQISGCKIYNLGWTTNASATPNSNKNANGIAIVGSEATAYTNIYIGYNELYNCITGYSETLTLNGNIDNFLIEGNIIHDNTNIGIDMAGHYSWTGAPANVNQARNGNVINNTVYKCVSNVAVSAGIYVDGGKWINIQGNKTYENGYGIEVGCENTNKTVEGVNVRNNFVYNNKEAGIGIGAVGNNSVVNYSTVTGNTLYKNYSVGGYGGDIVLQVTDHVSLYSNIVHSKSNVVVIAGAGYNSTNLAMDYNMYYTSSGSANNITFDWGGINGQGYYSLASFKSATGLDAHSIYASAAFVNSTLPSPDLHITSSSQAINSGDPSYVVQTDEYDIDGQARKQSVRVDIGADETAYTNAPGTLKNNNSNVLQVYPNPAVHAIQIKGLADKTYRLKISDENGNIVKAEVVQFSASPINISMLKRGWYILTATSNDDEQSVKFYKQ